METNGSSDSPFAAFMDMRALALAEKLAEYTNADDLPDWEYLDHCLYTFEIENQDPKYWRTMDILERKLRLSEPALQKRLNTEALRRNTITKYEYRQILRGYLVSLGLPTCITPVAELDHTTVTVHAITTMQFATCTTTTTTTTSIGHRPFAASAARDVVASAFTNVAQKAKDLIKPAPAYADLNPADDDLFGQADVLFRRMEIAEKLTPFEQAREQERRNQAELTERLRHVAETVNAGRQIEMDENGFVLTRQQNERIERTQATLDALHARKIAADRLQQEAINNEVDRLQRQTDFQPDHEAQSLVSSINDHEFANNGFRNFIHDLPDKAQKPVVKTLSDYSRVAEVDKAIDKLTKYNEMADTVIRHTRDPAIKKTRQEMKATVEKELSELKEYSKVTEYKRTAFSKVEEWLDKINPTNIFGFIRDFILCENAADAAFVVIRITEMYGLYWQPISATVPSAMICCGAALAKLSKVFAKSKDVVEAEDEAADDPDDDKSIEYNLESFLKEIGSKSELDIPKKFFPIVGAVGPLLLLGLTSLSTLDSATKVNKVIGTMAKSMKDSTTLTDGMMKAHSAVKEGLKMAFDADSLHVRDKLIADINDLDREMTDFAVKLDKENAKMINEFPKLKLFEKTLHDIDDNYKLLVTCKENLASITPLYSRLRPQLAKLVKDANNITLTCQRRQEPVCVWIWGEPRVGKSQLCSHLCVTLSKLHKRDLTVYYRNASDRYSSGYKGQDIFVYDDFASATEATDLAEFIMAKSCNPYSLNMADIDEKGMAFTSTYIIVLSNVSGIQTCDQLVTPTAIDGRRDFFFNCKNNQAGQFADRQYHADFSHLTLTRFDPERNKNGSYSPLKVDQYTPAQICAAAYQRQEQYREQYVRWCENVNNFTWDDPATIAELEAEVEPSEITDEQYQELLLKFPAQETKAKDLTKRGHLKQTEAQRTRDELFNDLQEDLAPWERQQPPRRNTSATRGRRPRAYNNSDDVPVAEDQGKFDEFLSENVLRDRQVGTTKTCESSTVECLRGRKAYVFVGETGAGKTWLTTELATEAADQNKKLYIIDEFLSQPEVDKYIGIVWQFRETEKDPLVLTTNTTCLNKFAQICNHKYDYQAFRNRVIVIRFRNSFFSTTKVATKFTREEYVGNKLVTTDITRQQLKEEILGDCQLERVVVEDKQFIPTWTQSLPDMKFLINISGQEFEQKGIVGVIRMMMAGQITAMNPQHDPMHLKCLVPVSGCLKRTLDDMARYINEAHCPYDGVDFAIIVKDQTVVFANRGGEIRVYKCDAVDATTCAATCEAYDVIRSVRKYKVKHQRSMALEIVDAVFFFGKITMTIGFGIYGIQKAVKLRALRAPHRVAGNEVALSDVYDDMKRPKSARVPGQRIQEYCNICFSNDCYHCIYYEGYSQPMVRPECQLNTQHIPQPLVRNEINAASASSHGTDPLTGPHGRVPIVVPMRDPASCKTAVRPYLAAAEAQSESLADPGTKDIMVKTQNNVVFLGHKDRIRQRVLMIGGHIGVVNTHSVGDVKVGGKIPICFSNVKAGAETEAVVLEHNPLRDFTIIEIDKNLPKFPVIVHHIMSRKNRMNFRGQFAWLVKYYPDMTREIVNLVLSDTIEIEVNHERRLSIAYTGHRTGVNYSLINTEKGDCGSPIFIINTSVPQKIVGIHSAANDKEGFGAIIYQEDFEKYMTANVQTPAATNQGCPEVEENIYICKHQAITPLKEPIAFDNYVVYGVTTNPLTGEVYRNYTNTKTQLWDSPLAFPNKVMEPAAMSHLDPRMEVKLDPYVEACGKYNRSYPEIDKELLDEVFDEVSDYYAIKVHESGQVTPVLTKTQAINGITTLPRSNPMARSSAVGYPWKFYYRGAKKQDFLDFDETNLIWRIKKNAMGSHLHNAIDAIIRHARLGQRTCAPNIGTLKDEPRKFDKIKNGQTRAFWASSIDKTICDRMYFHSACAAMEYLCDEIPIKVGINPLGIGFHMLYHYHSKVSCVGFDLDAKNWDSSIHPEIIRRIPRVFNRIYQMNDPDWCQEDDTVRTTLGCYVDRALVLIGDYLTQLPGGNSSGQSNTSQFNSIANHAVMLYIWKKLARENGLGKYASIWEMHKRAAGSFYGDDLLITVALQERKWFNPANYVAEAAKIGIEFTAADKGAKAPEFKPLEDMEFLKRNFKKMEMPNGEEGAYYCGALMESSFHHMLDFTFCNRSHDYWKDRGVVNFDVEAIRSTVLTALLEASLHGRAFFNKIRKHLMNCTSAYNIRDCQWIDYVSCFNLTWETDLPNGSQSAYVKESIIYNESLPSDAQATKKRLLIKYEIYDDEYERFAIMSEMPAVVGGPGGSGMQQGDNSGGGQPLAKSQMECEKGASLVHPATGSVGMLPAELYQRDIVIANITWSTAQSAVTTLFEAPVSPAGSNKYVQYYSALYYAWAGGQTYSLLIAATGFNGGKLLMVHLPPGYKTTAVTGLEDVSIFPYKIIDVKESNSIVTLACDEKNVLFHWRDTPPSDRNATGGTFAIYILAPLVNSNGTPGLVNMVLFNKPSPNFRVAQMMPISILQDQPNNLLNAYGMLPTPDEVSYNPYTDQPIDEIVVNVPVAQITLGFYGCRKGDGQLVGRAYSKWGLNPIVIWQNPDNVPNVAYITLLYNNWDETNDVSRPLQIQVIPGMPSPGGLYPMWSYIQYESAGIAPDEIQPTDVFNYTTFANYPTFNLVPQNLTDLSAAIGVSPGQYAGAICFMPGINKYTVIEDPLYPTTFSPYNGESIVTFRTNAWYVNNAGGDEGVTTIDCLQPMHTINLLSTVKNLLAPGQAMLFTVFDVASNLPVGYLKFYYEGVYTTTASTTVLEGPINQLKFVPQQIMAATDLIPNSTVVTQNQLLVESKKRRTLGVVGIKRLIEQAVQRRVAEMRVIDLDE